MNPILIVDDHPIVRQGLGQMLGREPGLGSIIEAGTGAEALERFHTFRPVAVVVDLMLGNESGLDVVRRLRTLSADVRILVMSMHDESLHAARALKAGADGYIMKQAATDTIVDALRRVLRGEMALSPAMQSLVFRGRDVLGGERPSAGEAALSDREVDVLRLIGLGCSTNDIANQLSRSVKTIEAHRASIRAKLGLRTAVDLVRYASRWLEHAR